MTLTIEQNLDSVNTRHRPHTQTHTHTHTSPTALPVPLNWSVNKDETSGRIIA